MPADPPFNRVLADLTHEGLLPWADQLEVVELLAGQELHAQGDAVFQIHFPTSALVILSQISATGAEAPVALVGNDGVLGMAALMGVGTEIHRAVVLHPGFALRLPVGAVPDGGPSPAQLVRATMGHLLSLTSQIAQTAFCQQQHAVDQRLTRWLLTALDRLPGPELAIDLPALAPFLGVSDGVLSEAAASLVARGVLVAEPGRLAVPTRTSLEAVSCGCHLPNRGACLSTIRQRQ